MTIIKIVGIIEITDSNIQAINAAIPKPTPKDIATTMSKEKILKKYR